MYSAFDFGESSAESNLIYCPPPSSFTDTISIWWCCADTIMSPAEHYSLVSLQHPVCIHPLRQGTSVFYTLINLEWRLQGSQIIKIDDNSNMM